MPSQRVRSTAEAAPAARPRPRVRGPQPQSDEVTAAQAAKDRAERDRRARGVPRRSPPRQAQCFECRGPGCLAASSSQRNADSTARSPRPSREGRARIRRDPCRCTRANAALEVTLARERERIKAAGLEKASDHSVGLKIA